jgi:hypothetical protein
MKHNSKKPSASKRPQADSSALPVDQSKTSDDLPWEISGGPELPPDFFDTVLKNLMKMIEEEDSEEEITIGEILLERQKLKVLPLKEIPPAKVSEELNKLIHGLAGIRYYLDYSDHLSDAELYDLLVCNLLTETIRRPHPKSQSVVPVDVSRMGTPQEPYTDMQWLKFYADEFDRAEWLENNEGELPPRAEPQYERSLTLPRPDWD